MHSYAIFQIVSVLASMALVTLPAANALPVRGALGNLGSRARAAKRAAAHHVVDPVNEKRQGMTRGKLVDVVLPAAVSSATAQAVESPAPKFKARSFLDEVAPLDNPKKFAPALAAVINNVVDVATSSSLSSAASMASSVDEAEVYSAYLEAMNSVPTATMQATSTYILAAAATPSSSVDQQQVYESYIAALDAQEVVTSSSLWARYTPSAASPLRR